MLQKKISQLFALFFILLSIFSNAQYENDNITIEAHIEKVESQLYDISFTFEIEDNWRLYSQFNPENASIPLKIAINDAREDIKLVGFAKESEIHTEYIDQWECDEYFFKGKAKVIQRIQLLTDDEDLSEIVLNMTGQLFNESSESCMQLNEYFTFKLDKHDDPLVVNEIGFAKSVGGYFKKDEIEYQVTSIKPNEVKLISYSKKTKGKVIIPLISRNNSIKYSVTSINYSAFQDCKGLTSVIIPSSVTSIGSGTFEDCKSLTSVTIPSSVTSIGEKTFQDCKGLTSVIIPSSVTSIGPGTFEKCTSLTSVTIPNSVTSIGGRAFYECTSLTSVIIAGSVTSIDYSAFEKCTSLTSVTIPSSVTSIGSKVFEKCTSLTSVTIPSSVTSIGISIFKKCTSLTSVIIPSSVTSIGKSAFFGCTSLISVTIPSSVTSIGLGAFLGCTSLIKFSIDSKNTIYKSIDGVLFNYKADKLIQYITSKHKKYVIPSSVTSIDVAAFHGCTSLTSVTIPNSVTSIGISVFENCTSLTSVTIPSSVKSIGRSAFSKCTSLTSLTIPSSVISIGYCAFYKCESLTSMIIPSSVTNIGSEAFFGCTSLTSVIIPSSVTSIGDQAFDGCMSLTSVYSLMKNVKNVKMSSNVFENIDKTKCTLYVPKGTVKDYQSSDQWKEFKIIKEI